MVIHQNIISGFIGSYTNTDSKGIYRFNLNTDNGNIENLFLTYEIENPTYLCLDSENNILYSSCKIGDKCGVSSFKFYEEQNTLNLINYNVSENKQPCHVSINNNADILISSNYHENKMIVYDTLCGIILNYPSVDSHEGKSTNKERQEGPHIHCSITTSDDKYILSADLGIDKLIVSQYEDKKLIKRDDLSVSFPEGSGPRHITYHKEKPYYYVLSELTSQIFVYEYKDSKDSILTHIQTLSSVKNDYCGTKSGAAIRIHNNGKFLYTSDRGNSTLNLFNIDPSTGMLSYVDSYDCHGISPRDFAIDPSGSFIICANEKSNNISVFSINASTGELTYCNSAATPSPTCILFS